MKRSGSLFLGLLFIVCAARADTIGLQFVVDRSSAPNGLTPELRGRMEAWSVGLNRIFENSGVHLTAEAVHVAVRDFTRGETLTDAVAILEAMRSEAHGFEGLGQLADEYGADFTLAIYEGLTLRGGQNCGRAAAVNTSEARLREAGNRFLVMRGRCGLRTLAHELGHLMGLNHGALVVQCVRHSGGAHAETHDNAIAPYANGFGRGNCNRRPEPGEFGTVMVGGWVKAVTGDQNTGYVPLFSNPRIHDPRCGGPCGDAASGDAARALNERAALFAGHESPDVHRLTFRDRDLAGCIASRYRGMEVGDLTRLECPGSGIEILHGLEQLTSLTYADLSGNPRLACSEVSAVRLRLPAARIAADGCPAEPPSRQSTGQRGAT